MKHYLTAISQYAKFSGRSTRAEFWYFILFECLFLMFFSLIGGIVKFPSLGTIFFILTMIPYVAIGWRRMHDTDNSGWFVFIPIYGFILLCTKGTEGQNHYGNCTKKNDVLI